MLAAGQSLAPGVQQVVILLVIAGAVAAVLLVRRRRPVDPGVRPHLREFESVLRQEAELKRDLGELLSNLEALSASVERRVDQQLARLDRALAESERRVTELRGHAGPGVADQTAAAVSPPAPPQHRPVHALADEGLSPLQIAQRLRQPVGEIELILNLRDTAGRSGPKST